MLSSAMIDLLVKSAPAVVVAAIAFWVLFLVMQQDYALIDKLIVERHLQTQQLQKVVGNCIRMADDREEIEMVLEGTGLEEVEARELKKWRQDIERKLQQ